MTVADSRCQTLQQQNAPAGTGAVLMLNQLAWGPVHEKETVRSLLSHEAPEPDKGVFVTKRNRRQGLLHRNKLRADGVLHGFILCTDDRLYHGMLAEEATKAWEGRRKKDQERDHWRDKKRRQRANGSNGHDGDVPRDIERCPQRRPLNVPRDVPRDVPGDVPFSPQTPLSHSVQETGQERELASASSARARTRLHPLPDDWKPNLLSQEKALRLGFDTADIGRVAEELCTWAKANDERKADWDAQFDRFVLREASQRAAGRQRGENVIQHPKAQLTKIQFRSGALEHAWDRAERLADGTS